MRLPLFYPFALALIAAMLWLALKPGFERRDAWSATLREAALSGFVVDGPRLESFTHNERASVEVIGPEGARRAVIGSTGPVTNADNNGVHYFLPADVTRVLADPAIEITFEVRSPPELGSTGWQARCRIFGVIDTGWQVLEVSEDWMVSAMRCPTNGYRGPEPLNVMLWSDVSGEGGGIELRRMVISSAPPDEVAAAAPPVLADR